MLGIQSSGPEPRKDPRARTRISLNEAKRDTSSYVDPGGYVFRYDGSIYRAIRRSAAPFYEELLRDGSIDRLVETCHVVPSAVGEIELDDPEIAFVIRHETIEPTTYCVEWCPDMLRDAAVVTIDLLSALLERDATLQDAYPWNILFRGTRPVFVDLTSIVPLEPHLIWPAYDQYQAFFARPLLLARQGKGGLARTLLMDNIDGVTRQDLYRHASLGHHLTHPQLAIGYLADRAIQRNPALKRRLRAAAQSTPGAIDTALRARFVAGLRRKLEAIRFAPAGDPWSAYYEDIGALADKTAKPRIVGDILDRYRPRTVVDIGCNTGVFAMLAAERGARVMAIDASEACIARLYERAKANDLPITPIIANLLCPTPAFGYLASQYPTLIERARSEMVLCLALMHHLHIPGRQSFERIARLLDALAERYLIFEFVAMEDANNDLIGAGRRIDYGLASVMAELGAYFTEIEVIDSDRETRKLLICSRETS